MSNIGHGKNSYSKCWAYDWRFVLSGAMDFDSAGGSGAQVPLMGK